MRINKVKKTSKLDMSKFINAETGELMDSELSKTTIKISEDTNLVSLSSDEFITIDSKVLNFLLKNKIITTTESGYVLAMANTVKTDYNALYKNNNTIHTLDSIAVLLELSIDRTKKLLSSLRKKDIIFLLKRSKDTIYLLNPYIARKRKTINTECIAIFPKFI